MSSGADPRPPSLSSLLHHHATRAVIFDRVYRRLELDLGARRRELQGVIARAEAAYAEREAAQVRAREGCVYVSECLEGRAMTYGPPAH